MTASLTAVVAKGTVAEVPFSRLVKTELRKLVDTRAGRWLLIAILATTPLVVVGMLVFAAPKELTYAKFADFTLEPQKLLLPVVGILSVTSEWSQRTGLVTFTLEPRRARVLTAKAAAALLLGLLTLAVAFAVSAAGNLLGGALRHGDGSWSFGFDGFRDLALVQLSSLAEGLAFGMLLLISSAAVVAFFVLPNLASALFSAVGSLKGVGRWLDFNQAQGSLYNNVPDGKQWAQFLVATLIWVLIPAALGAMRISRSEVKSG
jgi:ABC-type transport system involved in multi-copper enzyme maturation permease subunit